MAYALVSLIALAGGLAAWGLVLTSLRQLHRDSSPAQQTNTKRIVRLAVPLVVGAVLLAAALTVWLTHALHLSKEANFFLWEGSGLAFLLPVMIFIGLYWRRMQQNDKSRRQ